jgi:hypothetical protein
MITDNSAPRAVRSCARRVSGAFYADNAALSRRPLLAPCSQLRASDSIAPVRGLYRKERTDHGRQPAPVPPLLAAPAKPFSLVRHPRVAKIMPVRLGPRDLPYGPITQARLRPPIPD